MAGVGSTAQQTASTSAHAAVSAVTPGMRGYGCVVVGAPFVARWVGEVRRTPGMCRRGLTLVRLKPWAAARDGGDALEVGGDQLGGVALIEAVVQAGLLRCGKLGQVRSLIPVGQIARVSSSKAARTRKFTGSSVPSS
jgi:hypothetical protein